MSAVKVDEMPEALPEINDELYERIANQFKAMGNPTRLKILACLQAGERSATEILERVGGSQANLSKHFNVLKAADLVASRREGVSVYYRICDPGIYDLCHIVCDSIADRAQTDAESIALAREAMLAMR